MEKLRDVLHRRVYGQSAAVEEVLSLIDSHFQKLEQGISEPLYLHFKGPSGSGKSHTAQLIANTLYKYGLSSRFVFENDKSTDSVSTRFWCAR